MKEPRMVVISKHTDLGKAFPLAKPLAGTGLVVYSVKLLSAIAASLYRGPNQVLHSWL